MRFEIKNQAWHIPENETFIKHIQMYDNKMKIDFTKGSIHEFVGEYDYIWKLFIEMCGSKSVGKFYHKYIKNNENLETKRIK